MSISIITVFAAGILTFLTPCVLPLIPVYLAALTGGGITGMDRRGRGQLMTRAGVFALGFILVFTLMGLGASSIGAFLSGHKILMQGVGALLVTGFALKFLGILRVPLLDRVVKADDRRVRTRFGVVNAFVMGIVFAAGWSPCVGPVLGSVLTYTASAAASPATGALYLSLYGLGFALPLLLTAAFAEAGMRLIGRISRYLPTVEKVIGVVLLFIAGMLVVDIAEAIAPPPPSAIALSDRADDAPEALPRDLPVMVAVYKDGCPVCRKMKPVVDALKQQCDRKGVQIRTIDIDRPENRRYVNQFRLVGVPTFLFLDELDKEVARLVGEQTEAALKQSLSVLRGEPCPGVAMITDDLLDGQSRQEGGGCRI